MMLDGGELLGDLTADVCVVGAGAAGISAAMELERAGLDVVLLVGGGVEEGERFRAMNRSRQVGLQTDDTEHNTVRMLGGTTSRWGGWCRPLDATDFDERPAVPDSGWPFGREELEPFFARAFELCGVTPPPPDPSGRVCGSDALRRVSFRTEAPRRFGTHFRPALAASARIRVVLNASAVEVEPSTDGRRIVAVRAATLTHREFRIRARCFILACGAIQNTRLLLCSRALSPDGLGNEHGLVGRYFAQHASHDALLLTFTPSGRAHFAMPTALAPDLVRREQLPACHFLLSDHLELDGRLGALGRLGRGSRQRRHLAQQSPTDVAIGRALGVFAHGTPERREPALIYSALMVRPEQVPNAESRIHVDDGDRDELGMPRVVMDWRLTRRDWEGVERAARIVADTVGAAGIGRLRAPLGLAGQARPARIHGGHHHYGTTRMHRHPRRGVVDAECRVHGIANLFVAGGSVFPTNGYANPMVTMLALTVRLARHIVDRRVGSGGPAAQ